MASVMVLVVVFLIALIVNNVVLSKHCHQLEMRLRGDKYGRWRNND
ncbi:hypothetical protein [Limosilactobacillus fermentum]|nr:hypothetical protein [Limosilactobacillus fermentum]WCE95561.1 hypothetical protein PMF18_06030 [Limosilactobacillus fermentum]